jgi:hypothetical protein
MVENVTQRASTRKPLPNWKEFFPPAGRLSPSGEQPPRALEVTSQCAVEKIDMAQPPIAEVVDSDGRHLRRTVKAKERFRASP